MKIKGRDGGRATATGATSAELRAAKADTTGRYRDFQKVMFRAFTRPVTKDDRADAKWDDGRDANALLGAFVRGDDFRTPLERVQTYNRMYWYRTLDSLWEDFPGVRAIVGKRFVALAEAYLEKHPSTSFTLRHLGHAFPDWLRKNSAKLPPATAKAAADCAALEWALCVAFEAESRPAPDVSAAPEPAKLRFALQPHVTLLALAHDIPEFLAKLRAVEASRGESGNAAATAGPSELSRVSRPGRPRKLKTFVSVYRTREDGLSSVKLHAAEHALLRRLGEGAPLGRAISEISRGRGAPDAAAIQGWFAAWTARGWLAAVAARAAKARPI